MTRSHRYLTAVARAFAGAIIFATPLFMTMEMWSLGIVMDRVRLAAFIGFVLPLLAGLSHVSGFEPTRGVLTAVLDGVTAYLVAGVAAGVVMLVFGVIAPGMSLDEVMGKIVLQASAGSFGAILATSQFAGMPDADETHAERVQRRKDRQGYGSELLLMTAGALFLALNVAPTDEIPVLAARMGPWLVFTLMLLSLALMHAFVYAVEFRGQETVPEGTPLWSVVVRFTVVGYGLALVMSAGVLWCLGRFEGTPVSFVILLVGVLAFPAAVGAAAARLIL
ncbi:MAG: TIGR02587 family membrane protein [Longimicrobiales bacterium]